MPRTVISAEILVDSYNTHGSRLTTFKIVCPKFLLAEINTHRMLSRSASSSRAIPTTKILQRVKEDPFIPVFWGVNRPGMQAVEELAEDRREEAISLWLMGRDAAVWNAEQLIKMGLHKQHVNRILEPYSWADVVISGTDWDNFFNLRCTLQAQPEFRILAHAMREVREKSVPRFYGLNQWHLPFITQEDRETYPLDKLIKKSVASCARASYSNFKGGRDIEEDIRLFDQLSRENHLSPFEHVATPAPEKEESGNYRGGWIQFRHCRNRFPS